MLERILAFSIRYRAAVVLLTLLAAAIGLDSLRRLPIDAVPDITNKQVQVNVSAPAFSPFEIEKQVTFPLETALAGIPGLDLTRSISRNGFAQITAIFEDSVDVYFARNQVNERLSGARDALPAGAEATIGPISTGLGEVFMYAVTFDREGAPAGARGAEDPGLQTDGSYRTESGRLLTSDLERAAYLREVQDWIIRPQLRNLKDVAGVDSIGGYEKQYHVSPHPMKLVAYGLTFADVIEALEKNNVSTGAGYIEHKGEAYVVRATGRIESDEQIGDISIGARAGVPIRIRDVADIGIGRELRSGSASLAGEEIVVGTALMLLGANSRTVAATVSEKLGEIDATLPPDIRTEPLLNREKLVDATIRTVEKNLIEGAILVIVILFILLGNVRAAVITALAIPLSMLLTATGMVKAGISGNLMSLGAIDFGLIVDGAVIIVENCLRRLAERQHELGRTLTLAERLDTVFAASKQVRSATAFGEAIIITVYLPILALSGIEGKMFSPMAATVVIALAAAFVLSLTFVPAMVAIGLGGRIREKDVFLIRWARRAYEPVIRAGIRFRWLVIPTAVAAFAGSGVLFFRLGQEFVPTLDEQDIAMHAMRIPSTSLTQSTQMQAEVEKAISRFPEVAFAFSKTGTAEIATDPMPVNVSDTFIILKPRASWPDPSEPKASLVARIEEALGNVPGNALEFTQPIQMRFNELIAGVRSDVAVKVYGDEFDAMRATAEEIARILRTVPGAADVKVEQTQGLPVMRIDVDRAASARYGFDMLDVQDVVAAAVGGRDVGHVYEGDRRFDLVVRMPDAMRHDADTIMGLPVPLSAEARSESRPLLSFGRTALPSAPPEAGFVPLSSVARLDVSEGPNQISRENGKRRVVVQANVRGRDLGGFVEDAESRLGSLKLPPGQWLDWGGQFENLIEAKKRLSVVVPACFFLIFLLLYGTFHSVRHALLVYSGIPLGLSGGVVALVLRDMPFSISAAVGFIALSGVAVLNGLVLVTFINQLRREGMAMDEAIRQGSLTRLRPVLMTALVASLGFVPMAMATGTGAEVQKPLATVVIGGLVSSTILTLIVLPALYRVFGGSVRTEEERWQAS